MAVMLRVTPETLISTADSLEECSAQMRVLIRRIFDVVDRLDRTTFGKSVRLFRDRLYDWEINAERFYIVILEYAQDLRTMGKLYLQSFEAVQSFGEEKAPRTVAALLPERALSAVEQLKIYREDMCSRLWSVMSVASDWQEENERMSRKYQQIMELKPDVDRFLDKIQDYGEMLRLTAGLGSMPKR